MKLSFLILLWSSLALAEPVGSCTARFGDKSESGVSHSSANVHAQAFTESVSGSVNRDMQYQAHVVKENAKAYVDRVQLDCNRSIENAKTHREERQAFVSKIKAERTDPEVAKLPSIDQIIQKINVPKRVIIDPSTIPDPVSLPYSFRSNRPEVVRTYTDLFKITPQFTKQKTAREIGLFAAEESDKSWFEGEDGSIYHEIAVSMLDIAVGIDPISGTGRSAYELITGKNLITGQGLSNTERSLAFVGLITAGQSKNIQKVGQGVLKIASHIPGSSIQPIVKAGKTLAKEVGEVANNFIKSHRITHIEKAAEANARLGYEFPPYDAARSVVHFVTTKSTEWIRVFADGQRKTGAWLVKYGEIKGLTPAQIQDKLNLEKLPTHFTVVTIPKEEAMSRGMTHRNIWNETFDYTQSGQVQYRLEGNTWKKAHHWFSEGQVIQPGGLSK